MLSKPKRLSLWEYESLIGNIDVLIIGAGIVGLLTAHELKKAAPDKEILILEANHVGGGATTKNAGFGCIGSLGEIMADSETYGQSATIELVRQRVEGLQRLLSITGNDIIGYSDSLGCELFETKQDFESCQTALTHWNNLLKDITGLDSTFTIKTNHNFRNVYPRSIINNGEGLLHTGKLYKRLLSLISSSGVRLLNGVIVDSFEDLGDRVKVNSNAFSTALHTKQLIVCTNAFTKHILPEIDVTPCRNQVIVTSPVDNSHIEHGYHMDRGYTYFRSIGSRVLIGGGRNHYDEEYNQMSYGENEDNIEFLSAKLRRDILPGQSFDIDYRWSGILTGGAERLPIVMKHSDNVIIGVRLGGMGVAIGSKIALKTAQLATNLSL